ncbi:hypothetical protein NliqN6_3083 [Naganishia liquefaciens]|uniref:Ricin B lectin domain-containing protein n=1 Tax=Naganishia liquefaciens TaxID=104408 RepID=A0A8H3YGH5_9TREE|nr:hypothetical protein NliqN6_3083 [Naganishia liquefaciens]
MFALITASIACALYVQAAGDLDKRAPSQWQLHPFGDTYDRCLGTYSAGLQNGASLAVQPCSTTDALNVFEFERERPGVVRLAGTDFCLDAGLGLKEFKLWSCLPEVPQQQWFYTADNHLAIYNGPGLCATYAGGGCSRIYCFPGISTCSSETYQQWVLTSVGSPPPSPVVKSVNIHPNNNFDLCLAPNGPDVYTQVDGTPVNVVTCSYGSRFFSLQLWDVPAKGTFGPIKMKNKDLCLDAGSTPLQNGRGLKLWTCYDGLYQQTFFRTEDDHLAIYNDVQCADVKREDGTTLQTWQCSGNNPQQIFVVGPEF